MLYNLDVPDYRLDPPDGGAYQEEKDTSYDDFLAEMEYEGRWVPEMGETFYVPHDDSPDCFEDTWHGYSDEMDWVREGLVFKTANEAVAKAKKDFVEAMYGDISRAV